MAYRGTRSVFGWSIRVFVALAAIGIVAWAGLNKPPEAKFTQRDYYQLATRSQYGIFSQYPKLRQVQAAQVDQTYLALAINYVKQATSHKAVEAGKYDTKTRTVSILSEFVRAEAGLPTQLQPQFIHILRHEYGHALVEDLLKVKYPGEARGGEKYAAFDAVNEPKESSNVLGAVPPALKPVVKDWMKAPDDIYGMDHNTETFNEYLAESYARFMDGQSIPAETRHFLQSLSRTAAAK